MVRFFGIFFFAFLLMFSTLLVGEQNAFAQEEEGEVVEEGPFYLEMKPLSVPIRKKSGAIKYYMFIAMSMEFDEEDKKDHARKMLPRLRDAFLQDLSGRSVLHKDKSRGVDFEQVKRRLMKHAARILKKRAPTAMHVVKVFKGN